MKPYISLEKGKAIWSNFWEDKIPKKKRKSFKKTIRQTLKKIMNRDHD